MKKEDVQAESRADIIVTMPSHTLVIELKVHSGEGDLTSVVDALVTEFAEDKFVLRGDGGHGG